METTVIFMRVTPETKKNMDALAKIKDEKWGDIIGRWVKKELISYGYRDLNGNKKR